MRKIIVPILCLISIIFMGCKEDYIGQYPVHGTPPPPVRNVKVQNLPGSVILTYDLPEVDDLFYIKALYTISGDRKKEMASSAYSNSIVLKGFGKGEKQQIVIISVDKSYNESEPVVVEIEPLDSPIYDVFESLRVRETFGGVVLHWDNPLRENVVMEALAIDEVDGEYKFVETIYSSEVLADRSIRGLKDIPTDFAFYFRDTYNNYTDTLFIQLTPLFEEKLDKSRFAPLTLSSKFSYHSHGGRSMTRMWDNIYNVNGNLFYLNVAEEPIYFSFDMGVEAKLSRFRLWTRLDYAYQLHHIRTFEIWGTSNPQYTTDPDSWEGWVKIMDCESFRPSGLTVGENPTAEEIEYILGGEEWEVPLDAPPFRYMRFRINSTWTNTKAMFINEIDIWGSTKL